MRNRTQLVLVGAMLVIGATACDPGHWFSPNSRVTGDIFAARMKWGAHGFSRYEFTLTQSCECSVITPARVTVTNGVVDGVYAAGSSTPIPVGEWAFYKSIEGLLSAAANAIERDAWAVQGDYDPTQGFPRKLYIDWKESIADDEIQYTVSNVHAR